MFEEFLRFDVATILIIIIFFLFLEYRPPWWYRTHSEYKKGMKLIPGPVAVPVFGTTWTFFFGGYSFSRLHDYYKDMYLKYGGVFKEESVWNVPVVHLYAKRDIVKVLRSGGRYPLRPPVEAVAAYRRSRPDRYGSAGLVNEQGEAWHHLRAALTPIITSPKTISSFLPEAKAIADDWCDLLRHSRDSRNRIGNLTLLADRLGLELTCALILGRRMGFLLPGGETEIGRQLAEAVRQHFLATRDTYFGLPFWKLFPTPAYRRLVKSEETIYELALKLIHSDGGSIGESAFLRSILETDLNEREKIAAIVDFISAGIHTLKNSFLFLLHLVGQNPECQREIVEDDSKTYAKACLSESFRLHPTASVLARILDEEMELGGYRIAAGTPVVCHFGEACRDDRNFQEAKVFKPERWVGDEKQQNVNNSLFLLVPFGTGKRICPGKRFIEQILPVLLESTVKNFEIRAEGELEVKFEFLLAPKTEILMVFDDRI